METKEKAKRKLLLALPLLVLPFMALAFYALGGGKTQLNETSANTKGINTILPNAKFKQEDPKDKLGFYAEKGKDTAADNNAIRNVAGRLGFPDKDEDLQTAEINQKLEALNKEIGKPAPPRTAYHPDAKPHRDPGTIKADVDRLEALMRNIQAPEDEDQELQQLSSMMEKILDIQHPERLNEKYQTKAVASQDSQFRAIPAVIEESQKVTYGSLIKLKLLDTILLNSQIIPKDQYIFGTAMLSNQRILLDIRTIRLGTSIVPVNLSVYSLDGIKGIDAPEAIITETAVAGTEDVLRNVQLSSMDQSLATQVAGAGLDAAKSLFSKKFKRIKVKLKAGQMVLLRNNETKISRIQNPSQR